MYAQLFIFIVGFYNSLTKLLFDLTKLRQFITKTSPNEPSDKFINANKALEQNSDINIACDKDYSLSKGICIM